MQRFKTTSVLIILVGIFLISTSQNTFGQFVQNTEILFLNQNGDTIQNALAGGLNAPQFSKIHLNQDDKEDLFVFDRNGNQLSTFLNSGDSGEIKYEFAPEYISRFPSLVNWALLRDFNCDGKKDIFYTEKSGQIAVYQNTSSGNNLSFDLASVGLRADYNGFEAFIYSTKSDIPSIIDYDSDGDLDIVTFELSTGCGDALLLFKNMSIEKYGTCDSLEFVLENRCFGEFRESPTSCSVTFKDNLCECDESSGSNSAHSGSTLLLLDANFDSKLDALIGDIGCSNTYLLTNTRTSDNPKMTAITTNFPSTRPIDLSVFPASFYEDINNDNLKDLLVAPNTANASENLNASYLYLNSNNEFIHQTDQFMINTMLDFGEGSYPTLVDLTGDGLQDLVVGNNGYYLSGGNLKSQLAYFKNIGEINNPKFQLVSLDFLGLSNLDLKGLYPTFGDLDNDGNSDLLLGDSEGKLYYYKNTTIGSNVSFSLVEAELQGIDVGQFASPHLTDVNNDNLIDLLIGKLTGFVSYYENTGTATTPQFTLKTDTFAGIVPDDPFGEDRLSSVFLDKTIGNERLLYTNSNGKVFNYEPTISSKLDGSYSLKSSFTPNKGESISIFASDFDGNNLTDLLIGNYRGGLSLYMNNQIANLINYRPFTSNFEMFPNPASNFIKIKVKSSANSIFKLLNLNGKILEQGNIMSETSVDLSNYPKGLYLIQVVDNENIETKKLLIN
ncbi:MAG: hypothetical protein ACJAZ3_001286 [Sphingobacteriales bacterium]|jgi:hypothetical protein